MYIVCMPNHKIMNTFCLLLCLKNRCKIVIVYLKYVDCVGHDKVDAGELLEEHVGQGQQERLQV